MNAPRGAGARWGARLQQCLIVLVLAINLAGIAGIALYSRDPQRVALGAVPLSMLLAVLP